MKKEHIGQALHALGLKPTTSRLLTHMAWRCNDDGVFYESRATTTHMLQAHEDVIKRGLRELIRLGYVSDVLEARAGRNTRHVQLHPERWTQPENLPSRAPAQAAEPQAARSEPQAEPEPQELTDSDRPGPAWARDALREAKASRDERPSSWGDASSRPMG